MGWKSDCQVLGAWFWVLGCSVQPSQPGMDSEVQSVDTVTIVDTVSATKDESSKKIMSNIPALAHGNHMVFGIRMPRGMIPMKVSKEVHRFEGTHSIEALKTYLVKQLVSPVDMKPNRFGKGYFISFAMVQSAQADLQHVNANVPKYNIKIFDGSLGGASVDIWQGKPGDAPANASANKNPLSSTYRNLTGGSSRKKNATPNVNLETRQQRIQATFRAIDKMSKRQPLSQEDYQSPYFTEL